MVNNNLFKHNMQFSLIYNNPKDVYEDGFIVGTECTVNIKKSKISPKFVDIPCYIDTTNGGAIDEEVSFVKYLAYSNVNIVRTGSYYNIKDTIDIMCETYPILEKSELRNKYYKSIRKNDLYNAVKTDKDLANFLQIRLIDFINNKYPLQEKINHDYKLELMKNCSYFDELDLDTGEILEENNSEGD